MRVVAVVVGVAFLSAACTTVHPVPTSELAKLNGFREEKQSMLKTIVSIGKPAPYRLIDTDGDAHTFDEDTRLVLKLGDPARPGRIEHRYREITVANGVFLGVPKPAAPPVNVALTNIQGAGVREFSPGKTIALTLLITAVAFAGLLVLGAVVGDGNGSSGGGGDWD